MTTFPGRPSPASTGSPASAASAPRIVSIHARLAGGFLQAPEDRVDAGGDIGGKAGFPATLDERLRRQGRETRRMIGAGCIVGARVAHGLAPVGRVAGIKDST